MEHSLLPLTGFFATYGTGLLLVLVAVGKGIYGRHKGIERHQVDAQYIALTAMIFMLFSLAFLK